MNAQNCCHEYNVIQIKKLCRKFVHSVVNLSLIIKDKVNTFGSFKWLFLNPRTQNNVLMVTFKKFY